jgi:hypothetical protein
MNDTNREAVAKFTQWCMGSCHGDWAPETEVIYDEVMGNDDTYEFYRREMEEYERGRGGDLKRGRGENANDNLC